MGNRTEEWLRSIGLEEHAALFSEQRIDHDVLPDLTDADLEKLGIPLGHRKKLLKAIGETDWEAHSPAPAPGADAGQAERRQLTVMFCDLVGSTAMSQKLDPEDLGEVNRAYQDLCKRTLESYGGYIARYMGDGVLAYFGYPRAHEDDAERAILAGLDLAEGVKGVDSPLVREQGLELAVRVGIATGPVVVGDIVGEGAAQESAVVGETPNVAARLQALAEPGTVIVAPGTRALAGHRFAYADAGTHAIKGIAEPMRTWRVLGRGVAESRFEALHRTALTPLVGRDTEIALLLDRWQQARDGEGQVVVLTGEAGIGKSRIAETLRERIAPDDPIRLRYQCSPLRASSELFPFVEAFQRAAGFEVGDSAAVRLEKLEALLVEGSDDAAGAAPLVAALLAVPTGDRYPRLELGAEALKARTLEVLTDQLEGLSRKRPVLIVFEDAHWADPTSLELLSMQIERLRTMRVLMLVTARPGFSPPWSDHLHITAFNLNRFSRGLATAMVDRIARGRRLPDGIREQIIEKTDGVPLFVEELTKTVLESDWLEARGDEYVLIGPSPALAIPSTLSDSLMARLDRLGHVKEVAQTASVIGREFSRDLLARISPLDGNALDDALETLVTSELVFPHRRSGTSYVFKHALILDAAYDSLLRKRRRELHGLIAAVVLADFPDIASAQPEVLAHHYAAAGEAEQAIRYWLQAGRRAAERSANREAVQHFRSGLETIAELPASEERDRLELSLQIGMTTPITAISGFASPESEEAYGRARELCNSLGETEQLLTVLHGQWVKHTVAAAHREAAKVAVQLLELGETQDNDAARLVGNRILGWNLLFRGQIEHADPHLKLALSTYDSNPETYRELRLRTQHDARVATLSCLSIQQWLMGFPERASEYCEECIAHARRLEHTTSVAYALLHAGCVPAGLRDDTSAAKKLGTELVELARENELLTYSTYGAIIMGWIVGATEDVDTGIAAMTEAMSALGTDRFRYFRTCNLEILARLQVRAGNVGEARQLLEEAEALVEHYDERFWHPEISRRLGEAHLVSEDGDPGPARGAFERAMALARESGARALELRAATSLARLLADDDRPADARALLTPIYEWFTEGLDTPDLQEARSVLESI